MGRLSHVEWLASVPVQTGAASHDALSKDRLASEISCLPVPTVSAIGFRSENPAGGLFYKARSEKRRKPLRPVRSTLVPLGCRPPTQG